MSKFPIGLGNCFFEYLYIFGACITKFLEDYLLSLDDINKKLSFNIFKIETVLKNHKLVMVLYRYISYTLFGCLFYYISIYKREKKEKSNKIINTKERKMSKASKKQKYLVNKITLNRKSIIFLVVSCGLYSLINVSRKIISHFKVSDLDFWIFNIVFISIFMFKYFRIQIYKHQKYSLVFIFFTNFVLLSIAADLPQKGANNQYESVFKKCGWYSILIFLGYTIFSYISSFTKVASKKLMDKNYISPYIIIFLIGIFGLIFIVITLIFTSNISCGNSSYCKIKYNSIENCTNNNITGNNSTENNNSTKNNSQENNSTAYLDSIPIYFSELRNIYKEKQYKEFYLEIFIVTPLFAIVNFIQFTCEMLIILYLNPNYILISDCIYYLIKFFIKYIQLTISQDYNARKYLVELIAEILALMGYIVYLEIIELRFCGLNDDIKKNIMKRSARESLLKEMDLNFSSSFDDSNIDDSEDEGKKNI